MTRSIKVLLFAVTAVAPIVMYSFPTGAPPRKTGAPGDGTCLDCHTGTLFSNSSAINIQFPNGLTYTPGVKQRLTITAVDSFADHFGFELTSRLMSDLTNGQAGSLSPADPSVAFTECDGAGNPPPCDASAPVQFVTHSMPSTTGTWQVDWTPPATNAGNVTLYLAVNASNNPSISNKHIHLQSFTLTPQAVTTPTCPASSTTPVACGVENAASFAPVVSPGSYFAVGGLALSTTNPGRIWQTSDFTNNGTGLPLALDQTSVTINGKPAYVEFISPTQVNAIAPADSSAAGQMVPLVVTSNGQSSPPIMVQLAALAPAFFTDLPGTADNGKYLIAQHASDFSRVGKPGLYPSAPNLTTPAKPGETVVFYGTGFGATTPAAPDGVFVTQVSNLNSLPTVTVNGVQATVLFGGLIPPFANLYQFNVTLPTNLPAGDNPVIADLGNGVVTKTELINVAAN